MNPRKTIANKNENISFEKSEYRQQFEKDSIFTEI